MPYIGDEDAGRFNRVNRAVQIICQSSKSLLEDIDKTHPTRSKKLSPARGIERKIEENSIIPKEAASKMETKIGR